MKIEFLFIADFENYCYSVLLSGKIEFITYFDDLFVGKCYLQIVKYYSKLLNGIDLFITIIPRLLLRKANVIFYLIFNTKCIFKFSDVLGFSFLDVGHIIDVIKCSTSHWVFDFLQANPL